ncbi:MAG: hypothetical protein ACRCYS_00585 [Beijerinckiaceae bacterium]
MMMGKFIADWLPLLLFLGLMAVIFVWSRRQRDEYGAYIQEVRSINKEILAINRETLDCSKETLAVLKEIRTALESGKK